MKEVVGEIRKGQMVTMFGVGSMIDLPHLSVLVKGLHQWSTAACHVIPEPRLLSAVRAKLPTVSTIRSCPNKTSDEPEYKKVDPSGVPVSVFPRWLRCPICNVIGHVDTGMFEPVFPPFQIDKIKFVHKGNCGTRAMADKDKPGAVPVRFLVTCKNGHLDDFPWFDFCHRGNGCPRAPRNPKEGRVYRPGLVLSDDGVTGEAAEVQVRCLECDAFRPLADAFGSKADLCLPGCAGKHLHLGRTEACTEAPIAALLGASNLYFPLTVAVLALPESHQRTDLDAVVEQNLEALSKITDVDFAKVFISMNLIPDLTGHEPEALMAAIERTRSEDPIRKLADLREEEYGVLSSVATTLTSDRLSAERAGSLGSYLATYLQGIVLVSRLTEFSALVGFTRVEAAGDMSDYDSIDPARLVPLMPPPVIWVPGTENRGEGIFLEFPEDLLVAWENRPEVRRRMREHLMALDRFRRERPWIKIEKPSARYMLMHTLSHALMRELAITCGYSSTSLRERIYCREPLDGVAPMSGILIYTASPDSEGTLGGLVSLGKPGNFEPILRAALARSSMCSSDPICSHREIGKESKLHGASCHACSFVAETSCEKANRFLDRAFLVDTLGRQGCAYFGVPS